jgi:hypothetical protein
MTDDPMNLDPAAPVDATSTSEPEKRDVPEAEKKFVKQWCSRIKAAKEHHKKTFKRMSYCAKIAKHGADDAWLEGDKKYVVPVINRLINQSVSQLYAKNPKALAKRSQRRMFTVWDGTLASLKEATDAIHMASQTPMLDPMTGQAVPTPPDPNMLAIFQDAQNVKAYDTMVDGIADTLTILHNHFMKDPSAQYKQQLKALVRRTKVRSVAYVKLGFQRILEKNPDITTQLDIATEQHATLRALMEDASRDRLDEDSAKAEQLRTLIEDLQAQTTMIVKEGPVLSFPKSQAIIIDPACVHLKTLAGAGWVAEEYEKTPDEAQKDWDIDITGNYTEQKPNETSSWSRWSEKDGKLDKSATALVWRVMNRDTGQEFVVCDGHDGYLQPPAPPKVKIRRFFDIFPLIFNEAEPDDDDGDIYPLSDVWQTRHLQNEYNRTREGLREHRLSNRPGYVAGTGSFEKTDLMKLANHDFAEIIELQQLAQGEKIADKLQAKPVMAIDPKMYEVESIFQDILRVTGSQEANLGPTAGKTATESSIAEQAHSTSASDSIDDIDDMLTCLAQATGELMLQEMSKDTVVAIVGPGAVWPEAVETREDIIEEISLETKAGSSGRPNAAADLAKMERAMPFVLQLPGINPVPWGQRYLDTLDVDVENAIVEGLPSITATNAIAGRPAATQPGTGDPASDPGAQGAQGAQNAPQPAQTAPGPQPGFPAPTMRPA